jgi:hypothetical protein
MHRESFALWLKRKDPELQGSEDSKMQSCPSERILSGVPAVHWISQHRNRTPGWKSLNFEVFHLICFPWILDYKSVTQLSLHILGVVFTLNATTTHLTKWHPLHTHCYETAFSLIGFTRFDLPLANGCGSQTLTLVTICLTMVLSSLATARQPVPRGTYYLNYLVVQLWENSIKSSFEGIHCPGIYYVWW